MPIGLFVMIAASFLVFRRARSVGRSSLLWVGILWIMAFGVGFISSIVGMLGAALLAITLMSPMSDTDLRATAVFSAALGMLIGVAVAFWACGRPVPVVAEREKDGARGSEMGEQINTRNGA